MKIQTASILLAITVLPYATAQACDMPVAPPTPDGGSATLEDMIAAQGEVKTFQAANAEYLECVDDLMASEKASVAEGDKSAEERFALAAADYNAAVSREEQVAADCNTAIRAYKAANPNWTHEALAESALQLQLASLSPPPHTRLAVAATSGGWCSPSSKRFWCYPLNACAFANRARHRLQHLAQSKWALL